MEQYILSHIDPEPPYLAALYRATHVHLLRGRMASGHLQGRLLKMLVRMFAPRTVLEIGTFSGYSALCIAEGLSDGATLHTFEINDEQEDFTRPWLEGRHPLLGYDLAVFSRIQFHIGDAIREVPRMGVTFDMAFVDGDKRTYREAYEVVLAHLRPGGILLADNTLWDGHVLETERDHRDHQTIEIQRFNDLVASDPSVERVILPLRDGLTIIRKVSPL